MSVKLSVIIPTFNVATKITRCFNSLVSLSQAISGIEVIFVDDCSSDDTYSKVVDFAESRDWVSYYQLPINSGSPSAPRNFGLHNAKGQYVFHLDPDDEILPDGLLAEINLADEYEADIVRAPLFRFNGVSTQLMNAIPNWDDLATSLSQKQAIVKFQSTTVCGLYRRSFLVNNGILWPEDIRVGEDSIFLYEALSKANVFYSPLPDFIYHVVYDPLNVSSTQQYQDEELYDHLNVWSRASEILAMLNIDFMAVRGQVALQTAFQNMIRFNSGGFSRPGLEKLQEFLNGNRSAVQNFSFNERFSELTNLVLDGNFAEFQEQIKLRLLIAGYDLRFILPALPYLSVDFQLRVDEWTGLETHDEERSIRLLKWADTIHCEWMLGNAVWYSKRKAPHQSLQIRLHRFEVTRDYGFQIELSAVDRIIAVAPGILEEMQQVFDFPRELVRYIPNYIEVGHYAVSNDPSKVFNLVLVGSIPIRKGYKRALTLVNMLRQIDSRYNLTVYGKRPDELGWVINDPTERAYFADCDKFVRQNGLESAVTFGGWIDTRTELADKGFVLSLSDAESFHVAAAEGFASHNIALLLPWDGVEYIYPDKYVFQSLESMRDFIIHCRDYNTFTVESRDGIDYVEDHYSVHRFVELFKQFLPTPMTVI